jgi:hypothetical protein
MKKHEWRARKATDASLETILSELEADGFEVYAILGPSSSEPAFTVVARKEIRRGGTGGTMKIGGF